MPDVPQTKIVDRRFEIVLVCGPRGVIVQPGTYRVTTDALKDRDGLLKKQIVALVKAKRTADPKITIEPRVRFLVQPGGDQKAATSRQVTKEKLEDGGFGLPLVQIGLNHVDLVEIGQ